MPLGPLKSAVSHPVGLLTTTSSATDQGPNSFSAPFSMTLRLTDTASGDGGDLTFAGTINGTLTGSTSTLTADFSGPLTRQVTWAAVTAQ